MTQAPIHKRILTGVRIAIIALMSAGALLILVFGPRAGEEFPQDVTVIDYWEKWTGVEEAGMREIVNSFNNTVGKEKKIFVRYLSTSSIEQKTLVATAAGVPPDIAGLYNQNIAQFASLDALEPLDDYAAAHGISSATYKNVFWKECSSEGKLYGLVSTGYNIALYYNTEIFKQRADALKAKGLDSTRAPRTIAELDAYAEALDQRDASGRVTSTGYLPLEPGWYLQYTCVFFGGRWWDEKNHKFTFTDPKVIDAYHWVQSYSKRLGKQAMADFRSSLGTFDSPQNAFLCGAVAMEQQGTFLANFIHNQRPSMDGKWFAAPFPTNDPDLQNVTYCNCDVLVIPRGAKHKKEAFEFLAFVTRQEQMEKLSKSHCKISPLAKVSEDFLTNHPNPAIRVFDELAAGPNAFATEPIPILAEVNHEMDNFVQRLAVMEITPEEGLKIMQERLQKKYDDFVASQKARKARP